MTTTKSPQADELSLDKRFWWQQLTAYHWFVFAIASAAWFFDCLDQRIFSLARIPALASVMHLPGNDSTVQAFGKDVTACFLIGWGIGGMIFGALGDKFGRAKMLRVTILTYALFTGLSFYSHTKWEFAAFRFLTGVGIGGVFGLAVSLIAETVPSTARPQALGLLQVLSVVGNITSTFVLFGINTLGEHHVIRAPASEYWRYMFLVSAVPALCVVALSGLMKEPEAWLRLKADGLLPKGGIFAPYGRLVRDERWRRNLVVGALIASTGVIGMWAISEYAPDLQRNVFKAYFSLHVAKDQVQANVSQAIGRVFLLYMIGAAIGMWLFTRLALAAGRKPAFFIAFTAAMFVTAFVYWKMSSPRDAYWMMPLMGAAQFGPFAGFSIYLPELFPSALRSTGVSFCYNLGRFAAAGGSFFSAVLSEQVFFNGDKTSALPLRYSAMTMCALFLIGIVTVFFAPETKGKPLPQ